MALIHLLTAQPKAGKTQATLSLAGDRVVFFVPSQYNANPLFTALPWVQASKLKAAPRVLRLFQEKYPRFRAVLNPGESQLVTDLFMGPEWDGYTFVFDDFPVLFMTPSEANVVSRFAAGVRHRTGRIIITTFRVRGVLPSFMRNLSDEITQVGPLVAEDEAKTLYLMGGSARYRRFNDFYDAISTVPRYQQFPVKIT